MYNFVAFFFVHKPYLINIFTGIDTVVWLAKIGPKGKHSTKLKSTIFKCFFVG